MHKMGLSIKMLPSCSFIFLGKGAGLSFLTLSTFCLLCMPSFVSVFGPGGHTRPALLGHTGLARTLPPTSSLSHTQLFLLASGLSGVGGMCCS